METDLVVALIEDDPRLGRLTAQYLRSHGVIVHVVTRGDVAVAEVLRLRPDVVLLDRMLPGLDGLEGGADDYVVKPFSSRGLLARVRAQVRRARGASGPRAVRLAVDGLELDASSLSVTLDGEPLQLTSYEFALLRALAERAGRVLTREQLTQRARGSADEAFDRSIDVHVSRLRQKLGDDPRNPRRLKTVRGVGYMLASTR